VDGMFYAAFRILSDALMRSRCNDENFILVKDAKTDKAI